MLKILIDLLPAHGHFHAILKIAFKLKNDGYNVIFGSHLSMQKEIEKYGFLFVELPDVPVTKVNFAVRLSKQNKFITYFYWFLSREKYRKSKKDVSVFHNAIHLIKPDLILLDEQVAIKAFLYEMIDFPVVVFQTKPDTRKINGIPPFTSFYLPNGKLTREIYSNFLWFAKLLKYKFIYLYNRILSSGQDNYSILKKIGKDYNIDMNKRIEIKRSFGVGIKGLSRFIISPAAFDFPHPEKEQVYRIGPLIDIKRDGNILDARYSSLLARIEAMKKDKNGFIVYCSLGTISSNFKKEVTKFFKKMVQVSKSNTDCLFILSTGKDFNINDLYPIPDNLFVFDFVPQVNLLNYCDLMITHGGMNSITECVYNDVPMLIYPLSLKWDQPGNSARAVFHGLGLRGKIKKDSVKMISKKLIRIKSNHVFYKKNVIEMKKKFEEKNQSDELLQIIDNMLTNFNSL